MRPDYNGIKIRYSDFYENWKDTSYFEDRLFNFLFSEVYNDLVSKNIKSMEDWLKYYSTDTNDFSEILKIVNLYYEKILAGNLHLVTWEERVLGFNSFALYAIEMDVDMPKDITLQGRIMLRFIEIILKYDLVISGYLSVKGNILISDYNKNIFYTIWTGNRYKIDKSITLFKS